MSLILDYKYQAKVGLISHQHIISHMRQVLNIFANKAEYSKFYIGITNDLERRKKEHQGNKIGYKIMCPIYKDERNIVANSFHNLERAAINTMRDGIHHPDTQKLLLKCENGPRGSLPKNWLYILVG